MSVIALSLSMAFVMLIGSADAKDGQAKGKKGGAQAKKKAPGAKPNRRKGAGQAARLKAVEDLVNDLATQLNLTDAQKAQAELIVKKHMRTITAPKPKGPNKDKPDNGEAKPKGKGKKGGGKRGGKKKDKDGGL
jgi:hypothetical protein